MAIKSGDIVGDYRVIELIGSGGMGAVYKVEHLITGRIEAMKVLSGGIGCGPEDVCRFEREIRVQARLQHANIAALYSAHRHGNALALIMEYVHGESLQRLLERQRLSLDVAVDLAGQVLEALEYAHRNGVIHRDVSPANIIVTPEGAVKLTDFGLAREASDPGLLNAGVAMGSPWYMSPEQVRATADLDARSDIYSMGAILHEMLTGSKLFDAEGAFAIMSAHMDVIPERPGMQNPDVPEALDRAVAKALAKDPAARFQSAAEFRAAILAAVGAAAIGKKSSAPVTMPRARRFRRPRAILMQVLASAALVVCCGALFWPKADRRTAAKHQLPEIVAPSAAQADPPATAAAVPVTAIPEEPERLRPSAKVSTHSTPRAGRFTRSTIVTGNDDAVATPAAIPVPAPPEPAAAPGPPSIEADAPIPPIAAAPATVAESQSSIQAPEEPKRQRSGNGLLKALGKINPFRRRIKNDSTDPAKE